MKKLLVLAVLACSAAQAAPPSKALVEKARAAITKDLLDPYSARLENLRIAKLKSGDTVLCGTINAKNSFGAYSGRARFFYLPDSKDPFGAKEGDTMDMLIPTFCD